MSLSQTKLPLAKGLQLLAVQPGMLVSIIETLAEQLYPQVDLYVHPLGLDVVVGFSQAPAGEQWSLRQRLAQALRTHAFDVKGTGYGHNLRVDLPYGFTYST